MEQNKKHTDGGEAQTVDEKITEQDIVSAVEDGFPAPEFRQYQKKAIVEVVKAFTLEDKDAVYLNAPTGAGKSLILHSAAEALRLLEGRKNFFTTPLNSLVDQISGDEFIGDSVKTLKGRNNYNCIHPEDKGTDVDKAICQRDSNFDCDLKGQCPYYGRKADAKHHPHVVTNLSYLMAEGLIDAEVENSFGKRYLLTVDECQKLEDFAMNFISFTVSYRNVPEQVWQNITIPDESLEDDMDALVEWLQDEVLEAVRAVANYLDSVGLLSEDQLDEKEELNQFESRVENFIEDVEYNDWVAQIDTEIKKNAPNRKKIVFKPVEIGRFLKDLLWSRGEKVVLSSATMPSGGWINEIGLGDKDAKKINVPSTFPVENRPIITGESVGKMTKSERKGNAWPMAKKIKRIAEHHEGEKGIIHCRSYSLMQMLKRAFTNNGEMQWFNENCMLQDRYNREESLERWINSDIQVFFSVAMDEGISLDDDRARWQVLAKTLYKHMGDKRVKFRVQERNEWDWYNRHAAVQIQQAYGRAVRSKEDEAVFYILDSSANGLIKRNADLFNEWFLEAIDDMRIDPSRGR